MFILLTHNHIKRLEYQFYIHENHLYKHSGDMLIKAALLTVPVSMDNSILYIYLVASCTDIEDFWLLT